MQQDGTGSAYDRPLMVENSAENSTQSADMGDFSVQTSHLTPTYRIPANTSRFTFEFIGSSEELRVLEFSGIESISAAFEYKLVLASRNNSLDAETFMAKSGLLTFMADETEGSGETENNELLHGNIAQFEQFSEQGDFFLYRLTLVPHFWFLKKRHNHRMFQALSIVQIIKTVFADAGINPQFYELRLSRDYSPREYCVQYAESEFDFISRLMVENGLHYHFEHHLERHIMVIGDYNGAFPFIQASKVVSYHPGDSLNADQQVINQFSKHFSVQHGRVNLRDYSFKKALQRLDDQQQANTDQALEDYAYPGDYDLQATALQRSGKDKTQLRLQQHQTFREKSELQSNCQRLRAGMRYELSDNPNGQYNQQYLLTQVEHRGKQPQSLDEYGAGKAARYVNEAQCIPAQTPFKMPLKENWPKLAGFQSSAITGPSGEEIYTNEYAQSKVQFPWDREAQRDENSSCWLRSSQNWAGKNWGSISLPRMEQEVKVGFIHGDPERPIITGRLYNERQMPPYALPKHKTRSSIKSNSTLGGKGYNEIRFEDRKNQEQLFFHAEKDMDIRVGNDRRDVIQHDRHLIVDNNRYEHIKDSSHYSIDKDQNENILNDYSLSIGQSQHSQAGQSILTDVADSIHFKAGQKIVLEAGTELIIKAGGGFIKIGPSGITAQGAAIKLNSGTGAGAASQASPLRPSLAVAADKDLPGQTFKPVAPQSIKEAEEIAFKGDVSRSLQSDKAYEQRIDDANSANLINNNLPTNNLLNNNEPIKKVKQTWLNIVIKDEDGDPVPDQQFMVTFDNGHTIKGKVDQKGLAHLEPVPEGEHQIKLLDVDLREWKKG